MRDLKEICGPASWEPCSQKKTPVQTLFIPPPNKHETLEFPCPSPQRLEHDIAPPQHTAPQTDSQTSPVDKPRTNLISANNSSSSSASQLKPHGSDSSETPKGPKVKVVLEDPTWKVLPAALKRFRIFNDDWRNYAMFICYGAPGSSVFLADGCAAAEKPIPHRCARRTLSQLRRDTPSGLPKAQGREEEPGLHAQAYQGDSLPHSCRASEAGRTKSIGIRIIQLDSRTCKGAVDRRGRPTGAPASAKTRGEQSERDVGGERDESAAGMAGGHDALHRRIV
jgi:hypothetical protein